jgi:hypothetical protein
LNFESLGSDGVFVASNSVLVAYDDVLEGFDGILVGCDGVLMRYYRLQFYNSLLFVAKLTLLLKKGDLLCTDLCFFRC